MSWYPHSVKVLGPNSYEISVLGYRREVLGLVVEYWDEGQKVLLQHSFGCPSGLEHTNMDSGIFHQIPRMEAARATCVA